MSSLKHPSQSLFLSFHQSILRPQPCTVTRNIFRTRQRFLTTSRSHRAADSPLTQATEPLVPAPKPGSGPLLSRQANRALPPISTGLSPTAKLWLKTFPIFILLIAASSLSIFNYQKSSSSTVASILYALRTSPKARALLGDEIYFASRVPWISGELNQLHGIIDISFWVKGTKGQGKVRFVSIRRTRQGYFETQSWTLTTKDEQGKSRSVELLDEGRDPMAGKPVEGLEEL